MAIQVDASAEIEQTLGHARNRLERQIAQYRVWIFVFILCATLIIVAIDPARDAGYNRVSAGYFLIAVGYALLVRFVVYRWGIRPNLVYVSLTIDLIFMMAPFWLVPRLLGLGMPVDSRLFASHLATPGFFLVLLVNLLRADVRASIVGGVVAALLTPAALLPVEGFQPPLIPLTLGALLTSVIGVAAARQARSNLQDFARLKLLRRFLSPAAVERVMRAPPDSATALGGQLHTVTLLAADLRGFTAMSEKLPPRELVRQLNAYHGVMLAVISRHGGVLDKFIGDGTLVVFGLTSDALYGTQAADCGAGPAVACAKEMLAALEEHNRVRESEGAPPLRMGIGVHTGSVVAGNIGAPGYRLEYTVIGDAVNTASRLEGLTKEAEVPVLISADTYKRLSLADELRELPAMHAKGKAEAIHLYTFAAQQIR